MADDYSPGLEGVIAFETEIAEPDKDGGALRYRGVDIEDLAGHVTFGNVWALLVDGKFGPGLPPAEPFPIPVHTGDVRVDVQAALAMLSPIWGYRPLLDISDEEAREQLARAAVMALSYVAQSARGLSNPAVPQSRIDQCSTIVERFMTRWRGEPDPAHVTAVDAYFVSAAEHGMNASTFTARVIASTGADVAACMSGAIGAMSGPLHGGAPARVLPMIEEVERVGDAGKVVRGILDRHERLMGFGHRVYRAEDPRARVLRRTSRAAAHLQGAGRDEVRRRRSARAGRTRRAARAASGPADRDERRVLGGGDTRLRRGAATHDARAVQLGAHGRLVGAHHGAEEDGSAGAPVGTLHRAGAPQAGGRRGLGRYRARLISPGRERRSRSGRVSVGRPCVLALAWVRLAYC
jgi:citrate synthase